MLELRSLDSSPGIMNGFSRQPEYGNAQDVRPLIGPSNAEVEMADINKLWPRSAANYPNNDPGSFTSFPKLAFER